MAEKNDLIVLGLAGVRVLVKPVYGDLLAQWVAGYGDSGLPSDAPQVMVSMTPDDIADAREKTLRVMHEQGIDMPDVSDDYYEYVALMEKVLEQLVEQGVIYLHGSAICMDGNGYLFTAPSGTGKSTHARIWRERFGDRVQMINDDKPLIRATDDGFFLCGSPWNGKHGLGCQMEAPLRGIIRLRRGETNVMEPMRAFDALKELYLQGHLFSDKRKMKICMEMIGKIIETVPCYSLRCNMEPEAGETAYEVLRGGCGGGSLQYRNVKDHI